MLIYSRMIREKSIKRFHFLMKSIKILFLMMILLCSFAYSETIFNPLSKGQADFLYCSKPNCGNSTTININNTYINQSENLNAYAKYNFTNNNFNGSGNFTTTGTITVTGAVTGGSFISKAYPTNNITFNPAGTLFKTGAINTMDGDFKVTYGGNTFLSLTPTAPPIAGKKIELGTSSVDIDIIWNGNGGTVMGYNWGIDQFIFYKSFRIAFDNVKFQVGQDADSSIYYDGSNMIINPKEVGTGVLRILSGINQTLGNNNFNGDVSIKGNVNITQNIQIFGNTTLSNGNNTLIMPSLKKIDGLPCSNGDSLKWATGGRIYCD